MGLAQKSFFIFIARGMTKQSVYNQGTNFLDCRQAGFTAPDSYRDPMTTFESASSFHFPGKQV